MQIGVDTACAVETKRAFILDVDDIAATALQFMLADELEVHVFTSSAEALAHPAAGGVDVVLLGAGLIEAETPAVVARLREAWGAVPVLAYGPAEDVSVRAALAQGARTSIPRPFQVETVRRKVNGQIGRRGMLDIAVARGGGTLDWRNWAA